MGKYEVIIYWSEEEQIFIAEVPELPGCMAHGDTHEAALANVKEATQLWLDTAKEFGDPIPQPKGRRLATPLLLPHKASASLVWDERRWLSVNTYQ